MSGIGSCLFSTSFSQTGSFIGYLTGHSSATNGAFFLFLSNLLGNVDLRKDNESSTCKHTHHQVLHQSSYEPRCQMLRRIGLRATKQTIFSIIINHNVRNHIYSTMKSRYAFMRFKRAEIQVWIFLDIQVLP